MSLLGRASIRWKFYLPLAVWAAAVLLFVGVHYPRRLTSEFSTRLEGEAEAAATLLAHHLAPAVDFEDREAAAQGIGGVAKLGDAVYIGVFGRGGKLLAERGSATRAASRSGDALRRTATRLIVTRQVHGIDGAFVGHLVLERSLARLAVRRREDLAFTGALAAAFLAFGLLVVAFLERFVLRPIRRVTQGVENVAAASEVPAVPVESEDEAGQLARAFNAMRDRLERTTVSRDRLEDLLASLSDMLLVVDSRGTVRAVNRATLAALGLAADAIEGQPLARFLEDDPRSLLADARDRRQLVDRGVILLGADGLRIPATVSAATVAGPRTATGEVVLLARDMTETRKRIAAETRAEAEERRAAELAKAYADLEEAHRQLKEAQARLVQTGRLAAVGELAAGVAHELNNPLSAVLTYASLLEGKLAALPEGIQQQLASFSRPLSLIGVGASRCKAISDNLLAFSRGSETPMERIPLAGLVTRTVELIGAHLRFKHVELRCDVPEELEVWGSDGELQQVLTNLLMNAAQAVGDSGLVEISARAAEPGSIVLEVRDDGPGMSAEVRARIFEPFFTTKPIGKGTGLGLSIVHGLVAKHRGSIEVRSAPGEGAVFAVTLLTSPPAELDARVAGALSSPGRPA
jgi:two-component system phosphoglycerate transport system sensor histidine kinase PgtB